jgi:hypothetical protein
MKEITSVITFFFLQLLQAIILEDLPRLELGLSESKSDVLTNYTTNPKLGVVVSMPRLEPGTSPSQSDMIPFQHTLAITPQTFV